MTINPDPKLTHFGFKKVSVSEKQTLVNQVFRSVAPRYDLMNDLMSLGLHRIWKRIAVGETQLRSGHRVLDLASGTGDLAQEMIKLVGTHGKVVMTDLNEHMLHIGKDRLIDQGRFDNIEFVLADAQALPFVNSDFDCVTIAFGLRNITDQPKALNEMYRVLKPGGKIVILEFSQIKTPLLEKLYDLYSFKILPKLGEVIAHDRSSYEYLVESIRMHPSQEVLKNMLQTAGFEDVEYFNLTGGIVALHTGYKF